MSVWEEYKNEDAVFAIGSPTAELYKASFDATASANNATTFSLEAGTDGYTEGTSRDQLKTEYNYGIYNKSTSSSWWLASPNSNSSSFGLLSRGPKSIIAPMPMNSSSGNSS